MNQDFLPCPECQSEMFLCDNDAMALGFSYHCHNCDIYFTEDEILHSENSRSLAINF